MEDPGLQQRGIDFFDTLIDMMSTGEVSINIATGFGIEANDDGEKRQTPLIVISFNQLNAHVFRPDEIDMIVQTLEEGLIPSLPDELAGNVKKLARGMKKAATSARLPVIN